MDIENLHRQGVPEPPSSDAIALATKNMHDSYHDQLVTCCVCNQNTVSSTTQRFTITDLPESVFSQLQVPDGSVAPTLSPLLQQQYDVSLMDPLFAPLVGVMLSSSGVEMHRLSCYNPLNCSCEPLFCICKQWGCYQSLRRNTIPKFAIANGLYIGQLPEELRNMTRGTLDLLRPVKMYGRLVTFTGSHGINTGAQLTGHTYSTPLDTPLVL
jgi:hypothetical protein